MSYLYMVLELGSFPSGSPIILFMLQLSLDVLELARVPHWLENTPGQSSLRELTFGLS